MVTGVVLVRRVVAVVQTVEEVDLGPAVDMVAGVSTLTLAMVVARVSSVPRVLTPISVCSHRTSCQGGDGRISWGSMGVHTPLDAVGGNQTALVVKAGVHKTIGCNRHLEFKPRRWWHRTPRYDSMRK